MILFYWHNKKYCEYYQEQSYYACNQGLTIQSRLLFQSTKNGFLTVFMRLSLQRIYDCTNISQINLEFNYSQQNKVADFQRNIRDVISSMDCCIKSSQINLFILNCFSFGFGQMFFLLSLQSKNANYLNQNLSKINIQLIYNMPSTSSPNLNKNKHIHKTQKIFSSLKVKNTKDTKITKNFHRFLRQMIQQEQSRPTNPFISFLNINQSKKQVSLDYIPSIQHMISEQNIDQRQDIYSKSSIQRGFSEQIESQNNYELKVLYICLLQKIMKKLKHSTSESQRRKIIRGTWNILNKYCKDTCDSPFKNIGSNIEWGLLELISFNFASSFKEKYQAEALLQQQNEIGSCLSLDLS